MTDDCCSNSSGSCYQDRSTNDTDDQRIDTEERPCFGLSRSALLLAYGNYCLFSSLLIGLLSYCLILGGSLVICSANGCFAIRNGCFAIRSSWLSSGLLAWRVNIGILRTTVIVLLSEKIVIDFLSSSCFCSGAIELSACRCEAIACILKIHASCLMVFSEGLFLLTSSSQVVGEFVEREELMILRIRCINDVFDVERLCALKTSLCVLKLLTCFAEDRVCFFDLHAKTRNSRLIPDNFFIKCISFVLQSIDVASQSNSVSEAQFHSSIIRNPLHSIFICSSSSRLCSVRACKLAITEGVLFAKRSLNRGVLSAIEFLSLSLLALSSSKICVCLIEFSLCGNPFCIAISNSLLQNRVIRTAIIVEVVLSLLKRNFERRDVGIHHCDLILKGSNLTRRCIQISLCIANSLLVRAQVDRRRAVQSILVCLIGGDPCIISSGLRVFEALNARSIIKPSLRFIKCG